MGVLIYFLKLSFETRLINKVTTSLIGKLYATNEDAKLREIFPDDVVLTKIYLSCTIGGRNLRPPIQNVWVFSIGLFASPNKE